MTSSPTSEKSGTRLISASALTTFLRCPYQYWFRYRSGLPRVDAQTTAMLEGEAFHAAVEAALRQRLAGAPPDTEAAIASGLSVIVSAYQTSPPGDFVGVIGLDAAMSNSMLRVERAARWFINTQLERLRPKCVEEPFEVPIPGTGWSLNGRIDLLETDASIVDFKLSGRKPDLSQAEKSLQLSIYALAFWLTNGFVAPRLRLEYVVTGRSTSGLTLETLRTEEDCKTTLERVKSALLAIDANSFFPTSPESVWCSPRMCQFWSACRFGGQGTKIIL